MGSETKSYIDLLDQAMEVAEVHEEARCWRIEAAIGKVVHKELDTQNVRFKTSVRYSFCVSDYRGIFDSAGA